MRLAHGRARWERCSGGRRRSGRPREAVRKFRRRSGGLPGGAAFDENLSFGVDASFGDPLTQLVGGYGAILPAIGSDHSVHTETLLNCVVSVKERRLKAEPQMNTDETQILKLNR